MAAPPKAALPAKRTDTSFDAGLDVAYEVDLFGRVSRNVEAARGDVARPMPMPRRCACDRRRDRPRLCRRRQRRRAAGGRDHIVELLDESLKLTERRVEVGLNTGSTRPGSPRCATSDRQKFRPSPPSATARCSGWRC
jgi:hypothetical protein